MTPSLALPPIKSPSSLGPGVIISAEAQAARLPQPEAAGGQSVEHKLRQAALHGDLDTVKLALSSGARVDSADKYGNTPLLFACARGRITVTRPLSRGSPPLPDSARIA